jgi:hypothetical protein
MKPLRGLPKRSLPHLPAPLVIWEPAAGSGQMVRVLESAGHKVIATDVVTGDDFLLIDRRQADAIVTNPPYALAQEFSPDVRRSSRHAASLRLRPRPQPRPPLC